MKQWLPGSPQTMRKKMLETIGVKDVWDLYSDVPEELILDSPPRVGLSKPVSEIDASRIVMDKLSRNIVYKSPPPFMGCGLCPHYVPAVVEEIISRGEYLTAYTPYQAEISQGLLQALFEYQSLMAELLEMEVVNASLYDGATALGESFLMAARVTKRKKILVPSTMNPRYLRVAETYAYGPGLRIEKIGYNESTGLMDLEDLERKLSGRDVAAVYVEQPSFLGFFEENIHEVSELAHKYGALLIAGIDPLSLGVIEPPGRYNADIAIGEGQPLGLGLNFGGPLLGIFAVKWSGRLVRQMPGRLIGMTVDKNDQRGYAMILQTREQHIRREKATSNITTNEALMAIASATYLSLLGRNGLKKLSRLILSRSEYAIERLKRVKGLRVPAIGRTHWKEFAASFPLDYKHVHEYLKKHGIMGGYDISSEFSWLPRTALFCITEVHKREDIDLLVEKIREVVENE